MRRDWWLRAEVAEAEHCTGCNGGEWTWQRRAELAEAALARAQGQVAAVEAVMDAHRENCRTVPCWICEGHDDLRAAIKAVSVRDA